MAVVSSWCVALALPPAAMTGVVGLTALGGAALGLRRLRSVARPGWPAALLAAALLTPGLLLGVAFAALPVPVSNHDGAYHVEIIDALRRGTPIQTWYPHGYHATISALLGFAPWVDTARGTLEASQGLAILAPLAVFALGVATGLRPPTAAVGALILSVTFVFPYDLHLWGGWPLGMSVLLLLGVWATAVRWTEQPRASWALLAGLLGGAMLLTHGTEVYSASVGLTVLAVARARRLHWPTLMRHAPLALLVLLVLAGPYLTTLLGWARAGGATGVGQATLDGYAAGGPSTLWSDPADLARSLAGAGSTFETYPRLFLLALGALALLRSPGQRWLVALYGVFVGLLLAFDVPEPPLISRIYVATYPWADGHRLGQIVTILGSLLAARGVTCVVAALRDLRQRLAARPALERRLGIASMLLAGFVLEAGAVGVYKRLSEVSATESAFSADDARAMAWLRQHAAPDEMLANNFAADAGLWAPYKANLPILLPRSGPTEDHARIEVRIDSLSAEPDLAAQACALRLRYVYAGATANRYDHPPLDLAALERSPGLEEVFRSGQAAVFRTRLECA
jgi:hypothetical protein